MSTDVMRAKGAQLSAAFALIGMLTLLIADKHNRNLRRIVRPGSNSAGVNVTFNGNVVQTGPDEVGRRPRPNKSVYGQLLA